MVIQKLFLKDKLYHVTPLLKILEQIQNILQNKVKVFKAIAFSVAYACFISFHPLAFAQTCFDLTNLLVFAHSVHSVYNIPWPFSDAAPKIFFPLLDEGTLLCVLRPLWAECWLTANTVHQQNARKTMSGTCVFYCHSLFIWLLTHQAIHLLND